MSNYILKFFNILPVLQALLQIIIVLLEGDGVWGCIQVNNSKETSVKKEDNLVLLYFMHSSLCCLFSFLEKFGKRKSVFQCVCLLA